MILATDLVVLTLVVHISNQDVTALHITLYLFLFLNLVWKSWRLKLQKQSSLKSVQSTSPIHTWFLGHHIYLSSECQNKSTLLDRLVCCTKVDWGLICVRTWVSNLKENLSYSFTKISLVGLTMNWNCSSFIEWRRVVQVFTKVVELKFYILWKNNFMCLLIS